MQTLRPTGRRQRPGTPDRSAGMSLCADSSQGNPGVVAGQENDLVTGAELIGDDVIAIDLHHGVASGAISRHMTDLQNPIQSSRNDVTKFWMN